MIKSLSLLISFFFLITLSSFAKTAHENQLDDLFIKLKNTSDYSEAKKIEFKIWELWSKHPSEQTLTDLLSKGSKYMSQNQLTSAHNVFSKAI